MPPSSSYNWLCALYTATKILSIVARRKAVQCAPECLATAERRRHVDLAMSTLGNGRIFDIKGQEDAKFETPQNYVKRVDDVNIRPASVPYQAELNAKFDISQPPPPITDEPPNIVTEVEAIETVVDLPVPELPPSTSESIMVSSPSPMPVHTRSLQSSKVPSSPIGRLFHYGGLAASLGYGAAAEFLRRTSSGSGEAKGSLIMTEANIRRLVSKLSQMRGAALKIGQFLSIQDTHLLPPDVDAIFRLVQDSAHYMPDSQLNVTLTSELGKNWESKYFASFDRIPFAAASIGQVHSATLLPSATTTYPSSSTEPIPVAVKVQFPNIRHSISSDLSYVRTLLNATKILPKGMFLDRSIEVMKTELADECSYKREARYLQRFRKWLGSDERFKVPWVWEGSTEGVLVMEKVNGVSVGEAQRLGLSSRDRVDIAERITSLCLKELFVFRTMQTDPNWTNFLWNPQTRQIELVDFGATRTYTKSFIDNWFRLLQAAVEEDYDRVKEWSLKLGYLTGEESDTMLEAHMTSLLLLATPFKATTVQPYAFGPGSEWSGITKRIRSYIPIMLKERLTPPPRETYSLNRKLSGAFLLASKLDVEVDMRVIWDKVVSDYRFDEE